MELVKNSREAFDGNIVFVIVNPERSKLRPCLLGPITIREKKVPIIRVTVSHLPPLSHFHGWLPIAPEEG